MITNFEVNKYQLMDLSLSSQRTEKPIKKQLFNLKANRNDGLLLQIHNTHSSNNGENKQCRFIHAAFNDSGSLLALADFRGNLFIVDLEMEKYWQLLNSIGIPVTISFSMYTKTDLLLSLDTAIIHFVNIATGILTGVLSGHSLPATDVSYSDNGRYCLTSSPEEAIIWDLQSNSQAHRLSMKVDMMMKKVMFMPISNYILACFQDDAMHIWKFGSFECVKQIVPDTWKTHHLKSIAFTKNGRAMIIGGHTPSLVLFCLDSWTVKKMIELPESIPGVKNIEFVPQVFDGGANKILALLTNSSAVYFLDIESLTFMNSMQRLDGIVAKIVISPTGKHTATILTSGEVNLYSTQKVLEGDRSRSPLAIELATSAERCNSQLATSNYRPRANSQMTRFKEALGSVQEQLKETLNLKKLLPLLKEFGEYPESYRVLIWKTILQLPLNQDAYVSLTNKNCHPSYVNLGSKYPLDNKALLYIFRRLLSNLAHWCPLFGEVGYLPELVFPFVKLFHFDPFVCFESVATIIMNWCQHWFDYFPFLPVNTLSMIENVLAHHDSDLLEFYYKKKFTSKMYAWPLLSTVMSEVLSKKEWLKLWDHVVSNEQSFLIMAIVSYNIVCRNAIKSCQDKKDIQFFFRNQNPVDMKKLLALCYQFLKTTPEEIHPRQYLQSFRALTTGTYTVFNDYPKFILDERARQLCEIRQEEEEIVKEQRKALAIKKKLEDKIQSGIGTEEHEEKLRKLEDTYRKVVDREEDRIAAQRQKLHTLRHELRLKELEVLETTRDKALKQRTKRREMELERLIQDLSKRKAREEAELTLAEEEIRKYYSELLTHKNQLEMELGIKEGEMGGNCGDLRLQQERFKTDLFNLQNETASLHQSKRIKIANKIASISNMLQVAETEMAREVGERQIELGTKGNRQRLQVLENETKDLENQVEILLDHFSRSRLEEAKEKEKIVAESRAQRHNAYRMRGGSDRYETFGDRVESEESYSPEERLKCDHSTSKSSKDEEIVKSAMTEREKLIQKAKRQNFSRFTLPQGRC